MPADYNKIVVIGSANIDMVIKTKYIPSPGETILGEQFQMHGGGKGANQAVAIARLGGNISFISKLGNDLFGQHIIKNLKRENIDLSYILKDRDHPTGVAMITVDEKGENVIVVAPGANAFLSKADIQSLIEVIAKAEIILIQLEIPIETIREIINISKTYKKKVILNPAPALDLSEDILKDLFLLTPNRKEAEMLSGIKISSFKDYEKAGRILRSKGIKNTIITAGALGAFICCEEFNEHIPGVAAKAIDTTAAGDIFNGAVAWALAEGMTIKESVLFANRAASISVTRMGAQSSAPFLSELQNKLFKIKDLD